MHADIDIIAHRGASDIVHEDNTLCAFQYAIAMGCEYIETDLHRCADGVIVCFHDGHIDDKQVKDLTYPELQSLAKHDVPSFDDFLECCAGEIGLDIEIKVPGFEAQVLARLNHYNVDEQVIIKSFNHDVLKQLQELECPYPYGLLIDRCREAHDEEAHLLEHANLANAFGVKFCSPHFSLINETYFGIETLAALPCLVWTVDKPDLARQLLQFPIHGLITNRPDIMQLICEKPKRNIDRETIERNIERFTQHELIASLNYINYNGATIDTQFIDLEHDMAASIENWVSARWGDAPKLCAVYDASCTSPAITALQKHPFIHASLGLEKHEPFDHLTPHEAKCDLVKEAAADCDGILAIGSGTVNDICKYAADGLGKTYFSCASAASMNGYTSSIAALLIDDLKSTVSCQSPQVVISDADILQGAPHTLAQSGYADLLSKFVSVSDWKLSSLVRDDAFDDLPGQVSSSAIDHCIQIADRIRTNEKGAIKELMQAIILSGYSMALAGSSAPASGGEHLISHYLDMTAYGQGRCPDLHGFQVALGTLLSSKLYEIMSQIDPSTLTAKTYSAEALQEQHGDLWPIIETEARKQIRSADEANERLLHIQSQWDGIWAQLDDYLKPHAFILESLQAAGVACNPEHYGIDRAFMKKVLCFASDIRDRYTILHFARDCGVLEAKADEIIDSAFA